MIDMTKKSSTSPRPNVSQRVIASVGFIVLTFAAGWVLMGGLSLDATYAFVIRTLMVVTFLLAIPTFLLIIFGLSRSRMIGVGARVSFLLALVALSPFIIEALQDVGPRTSESAQLGFLLVVFLPWAFIPLALIVATILAYGLVDEVRINRKSSRRS